MEFYLELEISRKFAKCSMKIVKMYIVLFCFVSREKIKAKIFSYLEVLGTSNIPECNALFMS